ncbi:hypothetical protein [Chryseobacterium salviniae]|uniref:Uncharacterized protein n=1 Tax=Chryseobacterium salviniae TaxID=3101750 RepID=A0ABU6HUP7_9FLAO|nr:hypothetical protein [Chryseobacterium sp. T9W2-O]MEC3876419.1 hypothetical protein [Chryseobacterium sp. T9W2-O]
MKLSEYQQDYYTFTGKLSDISRQLSLAGIAIIWIFKTTVKDKIILDASLKYAATFIILSLAADLLQYTYQSITWSVFYYTKKRNGNNDDDIIYSPEYLNYTSWILFSAKIILLIIAYILIIIFLNSKVMV